MQKATEDRTASMEQRKRRRKKFRSRKPLEVDSCELVSSGKKSADIERLAHKYMQKCTVESSTESESDANLELICTGEHSKVVSPTCSLEVVPSSSMLSEGSLERTSFAQFQFLDPYDGDYEDISNNSDCSVGSLDSSHSKEILLRPPLAEAWTTEDSLASEGQETLSPSLPRVVSLTVTQEDELELHETAKILQLAREPSWLVGPDLLKLSGLAENVSSDSLLQPNSMECDDHLYEDPNVNGKQGRPILECAGEKLRKRLRVT